MVLRISAQSALSLSEIVCRNSWEADKLQTLRKSRQKEVNLAKHAADLPQIRVEALTGSQEYFEFNVEYFS